MPLTLSVSPAEFWDTETETFSYTKAATLTLEHSLVSISKWEAKWLKPFFSKEPKTDEETLDYIRCMTLTRNVDPQIYHALSLSDLKRISDYIESPMTATWFKKRPQQGSREIVTSEVIYYWMITFQIPVEFEKWHINRLMTLIRVCDEKQKPQKRPPGGKKMLANRQALNRARRSHLGTRG